MTEAEILDAIRDHLQSPDVAASEEGVTTREIGEIVGMRNDVAMVRVIEPLRQAGLLKSCKVSRMTRAGHTQRFLGWKVVDAN